MWLYLSCVGIKLKSQSLNKIFTNGTPVNVGIGEIVSVETPDGAIKLTIEM